MSGEKGRGLVKRPSQVSPHRWRGFISCFEQGCSFWTSEDGTCMSLVILRTDEEMARALLEANFPATLPVEEQRKRTLKPRFVFKEWIGREHFDGGSGTTRGKVWRCTDEPTPFPVYEMEMYP